MFGIGPCGICGVDAERADNRWMQEGKLGNSRRRGRWRYQGLVRAVVGWELRSLVEGESDGRRNWEGEVSSGFGGGVTWIVDRDRNEWEREGKGNWEEIGIRVAQGKEGAREGGARECDEMEKGRRRSSM